MGIFTPYKKHANGFKYTPRYYDPTKEALEQRRAELTGQRRDTQKGEDGEAVYTPGDYIRTKREARTLAGRSQNKRGANRSMLTTVLIGIVVLMVGWILAQKVAEVFVTATTTPEKAKSSYEEFDPYAPITIVPNDYDPSKEETK